MSNCPYQPVDKGMWKPDVGLLTDAGRDSEPQAKQEITAHDTLSSIKLRSSLPGVNEIHKTECKKREREVFFSSWSILGP